MATIEAICTAVRMRARRRAPSRADHELRRVRCHGRPLDEHRGDTEEGMGAMSCPAALCSAEPAVAFGHDMVIATTAATIAKSTLGSSTSERKVMPNRATRTGTASVWAIVTRKEWRQRYVQHDPLWLPSGPVRGANAQPPKTRFCAGPSPPRGRPSMQGRAPVQRNSKAS